MKQWYNIFGIKVGKAYLIGEAFGKSAANTLKNKMIKDYDEVIIS